MIVRDNVGVTNPASCSFNVVDWFADHVTESGESWVEHLCNTLVFLRSPCVVWNAKAH